MKRWKPKPDQKIFVVLVGEYRDRYPLVFGGSGSLEQFEAAWEKALEKVNKEIPDAWNYDDMGEILKGIGYEPLDREWMVGE